MPHKIQILLSTYNGSQFISQQLESILSQSCQPALISIRDDGSTDETCEILSKYEAVHSNVKVARGERLGPAGSFFELLLHADSDCDYFAFADQDDVWMPAKLENALSVLVLQSSSDALLYCSRLEYVDAQLEHRGYSKTPSQVGFANALVENVARGCTIVLNREARRIIIGRLPAKALMHDWWCYLVVSAFGKVIYDERCGLKYRLHGRNAVGAPTNFLQQITRRVVRFLKHGTALKLTDQALNFFQCYGVLLNEQERNILRRFLAVRGRLWSRILYSTQMDVWRQSRIDTAILRAMILAGRV
jgi:glycosyltransferase involved in cell wall biosynthesis